MVARYNFLGYLAYGFDDKRQQQIPVEDRDRYARALLTIAAADGLSDAEKEYFANLSRAMDMPEDVVQHYLAYDAKSADLEQLLAPLRDRHPVPYLLYDAIKVSSVDGYTDKERSRMESAARMLGAKLEHLRALEGLVAAENAIRDARLGVFRAMEAEDGS